MRSSEGMPYSSRLEASRASDSCIASCSATSSLQSASDIPGGGGPLRRGTTHARGDCPSQVEPTSQGGGLLNT